VAGGTDRSACCAKPSNCQEDSHALPPDRDRLVFQIGELQLGLGDKDKALQRYRAALQKDPENQAIKARIATMR
jgi:cytochrome c-type biogenesis protein CcmH/NrfG